MVLVGDECDVDRDIVYAQLVRRAEEAVNRVHLDRLALLRRQPARLVQDLSGYVEFAEIVEHPRLTDDIDLLPGETDVSTEGDAGRTLFEGYGCEVCHTGAAFTDSENGVLHDVGTLKPESGPQSALDTPTLLGLWATGPYLHDGSVGDLGEVVKLMATYQLGREMEDEDAALVVGFLEALTDKNRERYLK